ncbi:hypothetical protein GSUB_04935 [Geoalkalibacter subterraneus]|jgi:hypothetical protein|uniref:Type 4 fimbrial biogenesis protein PilX N-terminal domain-containing protein n=2 Tax=Geoalkalibacter subterraneus TaxID=483547 RepID=A0A0B5FD26_9BACT|nr:hypothetical protein GSUB_04935 [Geoalkalibacter subterraneus]
MALVLAVSMLLILTVLGMVAWNSSTRQLVPAGLQQAEYQAFFAAQRGIEYALNRDILLNMSGSVDLASNAHKPYIDAGNTKAAGRGEITEGEIADGGAGVVPLRLRSRYGSEFGANYYFISVRGEGPGGRSQDVETQVVRMYRHDDDSIFRTSGGG